MTKKIEKVKCEQCDLETIDYYPILINRGKIFMCAECYENNIRRSTRIFTGHTSSKSENN